MFIQPFPNAFGIDISDLSIKVVQLNNVSFFRRKHGFRLHAARSVTLPPGIIVNGKLEQPELVREHIEKLLDGEKGEVSIKSPWVVAALPDSQSFVTLIEFAKPPKAITKKEILEQVQLHIPLEPDTYYFDWQAMPQTEDGVTKVLVATILKQVADSYTYLLESVGLGVIALDTEILATVRAMLPKDKGEAQAVALVDLGAQRSSFTVVDHGVVQFSTSLPYSGEAVTNSLVEKMSLSYEDAETQKRSAGLAVSKKTEDGASEDGAEVVKPANNTGAAAVLMDGVSVLGKDIQRMMHFYYSHFSSANKIGNVILSGGAAGLTGLDAVLSEQLEIETVRGNPLQYVLPTKKGGIPEEQQLSFSAAMGLALRAADSPLLRGDDL